MKTLKQLLDQVNGEIGFDIPSAYIGNTDPNIIQIVSVANRCASLIRDLKLQYVRKHAVIDLDSGVDSFTTDGRIKSFALPTDFYTLIPDTTYQFGRLDNAILPTTPSTWAYLISRQGQQTLPIQCRFIGDRLDVFTPEAAQTIEFEYASTGMIRGALNDVTFQQTFTNDADTWLLDDALIELAIKWRYKREKGLDWEGDAQDYQKYENEVRARDGGSRTIGYPNNEWPYPNEPFANLWVA